MLVPIVLVKLKTVFLLRERFALVRAVGGLGLCDIDRAFYHLRFSNDYYADFNTGTDFYNFVLSIVLLKLILFLEMFDIKKPF